MVSGDVKGAGVAPQLRLDLVCQQTLVDGRRVAPERGERRLRRRRRQSGADVHVPRRERQSLSGQIGPRRRRRRRGRRWRTARQLRRVRGRPGRMQISSGCGRPGPRPPVRGEIDRRRQMEADRRRRGRTRAGRLPRHRTCRLLQRQDRLQAGRAPLEIRQSTGLRAVRPARRLLIARKAEVRETAHGDRRVGEGRRFEMVGCAERRTEARGAEPTRRRRSTVYIALSGGRWRLKMSKPCVAEAPREESKHEREVRSSGALQAAQARLPGRCRRQSRRLKGHEGGRWRRPGAGARMRPSQVLDSGGQTMLGRRPERVHDVDGVYHCCAMSRRRH